MHVARLAPLPSSANGYNDMRSVSHVKLSMEGGRIPNRSNQCLDEGAGMMMMIHQVGGVTGHFEFVVKADSAAVLRPFVPVNKGEDVRIYELRK